MSININNLVSKPVDTVYTSHGSEKIRNVLKKLINKQATAVILLGEHDKLPGGYADFKNQKNIPSRKRERRAQSFVRRRRTRLKSVV